MFADMKSMVMKAWHEHYALLAINCMNLESAHAAIRVAEKNRAPIILNLYQGHLAHFPAPVAAAVVKTLAESASVPVALALDHGKNPDCIRQAFRAGFSGLMIDASAFPLEENVRQTRAVVELAASAQLCVEGELGHLAAIDFQRLAEISRCSSVPLALHGGSGTPFDQLQLCTTLGVAKINVGAAIFERGKSALLHTLCHDISIELVDALKAMELAFEEAITPYLQASGSIGKA